MNQRTNLLKEIQAEDFALYETALYLDGHPDSRSAKSYFDQHRTASGALREKYEAAYGPLSLSGNPGDGAWRWISSPWPWEKEAN